MIYSTLDVPHLTPERGFHGRVLRVNLSELALEVERLDEAFFHKYAGGRAMVGYFLLRDLPAGANPLGPENLLVFAPGIVTGTGVPASGRHGVGAKSPLTDGFGSSESGGWWGSNLKKAGFDGIVIAGRADIPVYLWIRDGHVEIRDARHLWGKATAETEDLIRNELIGSAAANKNRRICIAQIGLAGENAVRFSAIINNANRAAGRTGLGAVMGAKNLKAVAVQGSGKVGVADKERTQEVSRWLARNYRDLPPIASLVEMGTPVHVARLGEIGGLPTHNYGAPLFEEVEAISGETMADTVRIDRDTCDACPIRCKQVVELDGDDFSVDSVYGGPEYETLASFGSYCGVNDLPAVCKANELCNAYGLDTISTGSTIAFVMECFDTGLLDESDTGGFSLRFGDGHSMVQAVEMIAHREGFGTNMAEGSARLAAEIGRGAEELAIHVKGQELPMHEPRFKWAQGVGYAVSPTGADHIHNLHDSLVASHNMFFEYLEPFGITEPIQVNDLSQRKIEMLYLFSNYMHAMDSMVVCHMYPYNFVHLSEILGGVGGWETDIWDVVRLGERAATLGKLFNLREGMTAEDDRLPKRMLTAFKKGPLAGMAPTLDQWMSARAVYYKMMGWDPQSGVPESDRLELLGISEFQI